MRGHGNGPTPDESKTPLFMACDPASAIGRATSQSSREVTVGIGARHRRQGRAYRRSDALEKRRKLMERGLPIASGLPAMLCNW